MQQLGKCIINYRALSIMNTDCNVVCGRILIPFFKCALMVSFSTSFFTILRFYEQLNLPSFTLLALFVWSTILILIPTAFVLSSLFKASKQFLSSLILRIQKIEKLPPEHKGILLRQLLACNQIRCQVGGMYYMEEKAKLTIIHKVINGLKYLLVNVKCSWP